MKRIFVLLLSLCILCACGKNKVIGIPETTERQPEPAVVATKGFMGMSTEFYNGLAIGLVATVVGIGLTWYFTNNANKKINEQNKTEIRNKLVRTSELEQAIHLLNDAGRLLVPANLDSIRDVVRYMTQEQDPGKAIEEYQNLAGRFLKAHNHFFSTNENNITFLCGEAINTTCLSAIYNPIFNDTPDKLLLLRDYIQQACLKTQTTFSLSPQLPWPQVQGPAQ